MYERRFRCNYRHRNITTVTGAPSSTTAHSAMSAASASSSSSMCHVSSLYKLAPIVRTKFPVSSDGVGLQFDASRACIKRFTTLLLLRFLKPRLHDTTCCQTGCQTGLTTGCIVYTNIQPVVKPVWQPVWQPAVSCTTRFDDRLYRVNKHPTGCQTCMTTGLTTGWMFVYTIQPVVKPVVQPVLQPVVSCKGGFNVVFHWQL